MSPYHPLSRTQGEEQLESLEVPCKHCGRPIKAFWRAVMVNLPSRSGWLVRTGPYHEACGRKVGSNTSGVCDSPRARPTT